MFNTQQYNSQAYNTGIAGNQGQVTGDIVYGDLVLHQTTVSRVTKANFQNGGGVEANTYSIPSQDGIGLNSYYMRGKIVEFEGTLIGDTKEELEKTMETFLGKLSIPNQTLKVQTKGTFYQSNAYCVNLERVFDREHYNNTFIKFYVMFEIDSPFWENVSLNTNTYENITGTLNEEIINTGTAFATPIITLSFVSASSTDEVIVDFGDTSLTISESITTNDILRIDSQEKTVTLNSTEVEYTGKIPVLSVGSNTFSISCNGTYDTDITINYRTRFI